MRMTASGPVPHSSAYKRPPSTVTNDPPVALGAVAATCAATEPKALDSAIATTPSIARDIRIGFVGLALRRELERAPRGEHRRLGERRTGLDHDVGVRRELNLRRISLIRL